MLTQPVPLLVEPAWLAWRLGDPGVRIIDARWRGEFDAKNLHRAEHIPGATHLDWSKDLRTNGPLPRGVPGPVAFAALLSQHGVDEQTHVVTYADDDYSGATRLWWALRYYGHGRVSVLNGGLNAWIAAGLPLTNDQPSPPGRVFVPRPVPALRATRADVLAALSRRDAIVDTRTYEQYGGRAVWSPRGNVFADAGQDRVTVGGLAIRTGRIPGAVHLNSSENLDSTRNWRFRPADELRTRAEHARLRTGHRVITYCGVGISATLGLFSLALAGFEDLALYDASWEEWGSVLSLPIETD
ncbi:MAG: sulfurtransferase [Dehalococcoidia bacterium]